MSVTFLCLFKLLSSFTPPPSESTEGSVRHEAMEEGGVPSGNELHLPSGPLRRALGGSPMTAERITFTTERLTLRPPVLEDAQAVFRNYASDPEVTRAISCGGRTSMSRRPSSSSNRALTAGTRARS